MILKIANDDRSIIKKGVYLFSLVEYPKIQDWEWNNILAFISYEKACGDKLEIVCENDDILSAVQDAADKIDGKEYKLNDTKFPTIDKKNPYKLTEEEAEIIERLKMSFMRSEKLNKHINFLYAKGHIYKKFNSRNPFFLLIQ